MITLREDHSLADALYISQLDTTRNLNPDEIYCPEIMQEIGRMYFLEEQREGGYICKLNIYNPQLAFVVNGKGIIKVGNYIYQFTKNFDKYVSAEHPELINDMLSASQTTTVNNVQIVVNEASGKILPYNCNGPPPNWWHPVSYNWSCNGFTTFDHKGRKKITAEAYYSYQRNPNCLAFYIPRLYVETHSYYKPWPYINWHDQSCDMTTSLNWSPNFPVRLQSGHVTYWANNNTHWQWNSLYFNGISFSSYNSMFNPNNFYCYTTRTGGQSGGSTYCSH